MEEKYIFIDAGHLQYYRETMFEWFGEQPELDFDELRKYFQAHKCFYYDSLDELKRQGETEAELQSRIKQQKAELSQIRSFFGTHVRLGSMTGSERNRRQKEVDILLAVDMLNHAARRNMKHAVLISGDRDFRPAVESLVQLGLFIEVAGDARHTSAELAESSDYYSPLSIVDYFNWCKPKQRNAKLLPSLSMTHDLNIESRHTLLKSGQAGDMHVGLYSGPSYKVVFYKIPGNPVNVITPEGRWRNDDEYLLLFCKLFFKKIEWV